MTVSSRNATPEAPVLTVVRQEKEILSWQVPLPVKDSHGSVYYPETARTLCHDDNNNSTLTKIYNG